LYPIDGIQRIIVDSGNFFEISHLTAVDPFIPDDAVIFDLGSNIGNHALYWATRRKARKVYAFEPVPATFEILARNVALNQLDKTIVPINMAVGDVKENLTVKWYYLGNIGGTELAKGPTGTIPAIPLDEFQFPEGKVDFVKIDVESFEVSALQGALNFLRRFRPKYIFIELRSHENRFWTTGYLRAMDMEQILYLPPENFVFERKDRA
jgi:FkbM family methyltransferase